MLQLIGTFLPILGLALTFLLACNVRPGMARISVLLLGPAVTLAVCMSFAESIGANGNMLFVALLLILWIFLLAYYPILIAIWAIREVRKRRAS
jgi:hypothetical protein